MAHSPTPFSHWNKHAQQWRFVKAPLRPCAEDVALIEQTLFRHFATRATLSALLMGVTPELAAHRWKSALDFVAVDNTPAMIKSVWPGNAPHRIVLCGDWLRLPFRDACMDLALIDGGLLAIPFPGAHRELASQLRRILKPGGLFVARIFARPNRTEAVDEVLAAVQERKIGSFHAFKWRLAMSLQGEDAGRGVHVHDIWRRYHQHFGDHARLERLTGWPIEEIRTIDAYRSSPASYHFPSVREMVDALEALSCVEQVRGTYELSERCPTLVFQRARAP